MSAGVRSASGESADDREVLATVDEADGTARFVVADVTVDDADGTARFVVADVTVDDAWITAPVSAARSLEAWR